MNAVDYHVGAIGHLLPPHYEHYRLMATLSVAFSQDALLSHGALFV